MTWLRELGAWRAAVIVGIASLGLCAWRLMPGIGFWDTAEFQMVPPVLGTAHPTGYPTYVLIGWVASVVLAPLGEAAFRMNVLSAILVAVGVAFTTDLARRVSGSVVLGIAAGLSVAVTPIVWAIGTHADPHALHFTLVAIFLWFLVRWEHERRGNPMDPDADPDLDWASAALPKPRADRLLLAAAAVVGLAVGNHSLTLLFGPPIILYVLAVEPGILGRRGFIAANIAAFAIPTVLVRFEMILRGGWLRAPFVYANPSTWDGFWYVTLGAQFHGWVTDPFGDIPGRIADLIEIGTSQLGILAPLVFVALAVTIVRQPRYALLTGTAFAITCFFNSVYPDGAIDRYYIVPVLIVWTWFAILGAAVVDVVTGASGIGGLRLPGPARSAGLIALALLLVVPGALAFSDRATLVDRTQDHAAQAWTDDVLNTLEPNAVVVSWWSYSTPLWYATIVDGRRPDILIIDDRDRLDQNLGDLDQVIDRFIATRPVYLIRNGSSELPALEGRFVVQPAGGPVATNLLRVTAIGATG